MVIHVQMDDDDENEILASLLAGGVAGAIAKTSIAPLDRAKIIFQVTPHYTFSFLKAFRLISKIAREDGVFALWRGNSATMLRIIPYAAIQFCAHEQYKKLLRTTPIQCRKEKGDFVLLKRFLAGSLAGFTASFLTYPLDLLRANMTVSMKHERVTLRATASLLYSHGGFIALYKGITATLLGSGLYSGIGFFTNETLKSKFKRKSATLSDGDLYTYQRFLFGALAGIVSQVISYPVDIVRRRIQTAWFFEKKHYTSILGTAYHIFKQEGMKKGLYKGLSMNWIKGPIANGVGFTVFDLLFNYFLHS